MVTAPVPKAFGSLAMTAALPAVASTAEVVDGALLMVVPPW